MVNQCLPAAAAGLIRALLNRYIWPGCQRLGLYRLMSLVRLSIQLARRMISCLLMLITSRANHELGLNVEWRGGRLYLAEIVTNTGGRSVRLHTQHCMVILGAKWAWLEPGRFRNYWC